MEYNSLSEELQKRIINDKFGGIAPKDEAIRRNPNRDKATLWRPAFVRDTEKILNCPFYNRYADKTQVFSFYKNDDISRRSLHVQLVSRIARNIGSMLGLNLELIEAIASGHDLGHTPFGHSGEHILNRIYNSRTGRIFNHNVHSVRVLDKIFNYNISLQTLDGILCHNGESEKQEYIPSPMTDFSEFDKIVEKCYTEKGTSEKLIPSTLEGCVVRISDIIAYLGKDRQDAVTAKLLNKNDSFHDGIVGSYNAKIINNLIVNIIENSYRKNAICLDTEHFNELKRCKNENYEIIYLNPSVKKLNPIIEPMFERMYEKFINDLKNHDKSSVIYRHHIEYINERNAHYENNGYLQHSTPDDIAVDYIASMTDDYFTELHEYLFPNKSHIEYVSYFK